jgi:hypothetical protein
LPVDQVEAVGPTGVGALRRIAELVEDCREFDSQFADAGSRDEGAFLFVLWTGEDHFVFDIAPHLPHVTGMRLGDVDDEE